MSRQTATPPLGADGGPDARALPRLLPTTGGPSLGDHLRRWGPLPGGGGVLIDEVERAGLRGRGGASFPTAVKLRAVAAGRRTVVVANGTEGEPASGKDKALLIGAPHLVLDGLSLAAECVGAREAIVCVDRTATAALQSVNAALFDRNQLHPDRVEIRVAATPTGYVTGEESALVRSLNGGAAKPTFGPRPFERGVGSHPTLVNNVETLAHLALIARFGSAWYRSLGTARNPGTALLTLTGDLARPGVYEFPLGVPLTEVLLVAGAARAPSAILIGGYAGTWLPGAVATTLALDSASLEPAAASLGCGAICVIGPGSCGLREAAAVARWLADQSAGQCGPCVKGLPAIAGALEALVAGDRGHRWEKQLGRWLDMVDGRGACHHPDGAVRFVRSALRTFADEVDKHRRQGPCRSRRTVLPIPRAGENRR